ncbi:MAG: terminase small subunit [Planctomycetes bacterium]|nr:terminase small subunit [Planctomycetota bacterium]
MARRDLTVKQRKWLKLYVKLGNATEAAMQVYDCKDREIAASVGCENLTKLKGKYTEVMEAAGIDDAFLAGVLKEGLEATSVSRAQKDGKFGDTEVDVDYQAVQPEDPDPFDARPSVGAPETNGPHQPTHRPQKDRHHSG